MAIVKKEALKVQKRLDPSVELPRDRYTLACKSEEFGLSKSSQQPMVTRVWELIAPQVINIAGVEVAIAGTEFVQYLSLGSEDPAKVDGNLNRFLEENAKLGLKSDEVDTENPIPTPKAIKENPELAEQSAVGKLVDACCYGEEYSPRKSPTPEQKAKRQQGDFIMVNGKKIVRYTPKLGEVYGLSTGEVPAASGAAASNY